LGGTKILGALVNSDGQVLAQQRWPTPAGNNESIRGGVLMAADSLVRLAQQKDITIHGIAVGAPGYIDEGGMILDATNLGVANLPLRADIETAFGLPTLVMHDVKAAALGESKFGAGVGSQHMAFISLGTGIGAGLILRGTLYEGAGGRAGEIGHVCIQRDGPACTCGRRGCLEMVAAGPAIARQGQVKAAEGESAMTQLAGGEPSKITSEIVAEAAQQGDVPALEILHLVADYLGLTLAGLINVLDLDHVIIGGGLAQMGSVLLDPIRQATFNYALPIYSNTTRITASALGPQAVVVGAMAALLAQSV
jgi:glucokinase